MTIGLVCSQRSIRYPKKPPTTIADTMTTGNSNALANWVDVDSGRFLGGGDEGETGCSVSTKSCGEKYRIRCQPNKRLRINSSSDGHETQHAKSKFLPKSNNR